MVQRQSSEGFRSGLRGRLIANQTSAWKGLQLQLLESGFESEAAESRYKVKGQTKSGAGTNRFQSKSDGQTGGYAVRQTVSRAGEQAKLKLQ